MKLAVIGTGYVGLVAGVCFAEAGNDVECVDINLEKLERLRAGELPIYEPGLEHLFRRNAREERLQFTNDLAGAIKDAEIIFLALPTPPGADGAADLKYVLGASSDIGKLLTAGSHYKVIVTKSTVPVGTADKVRAAIAQHAQSEFDVVSNPEFLREGVAVDDFLKPERVVIGINEGSTDPARAERLMRDLYHPFLMSGNPLLVMDARSAELTKYAANSMLAMRISFMNDIATLCERCGANVDKVRLGVGLDSRIGKRFLFAGTGYGGSCFGGEERVWTRENGSLRSRTLRELWEVGGEVTHDKACDWKTPQLDILAFDCEKGEAVIAPVTALTKRRYDGAMVTFKTAMGRTLRVTPDHPVIVREDGELAMRLAATIQAGDELLLSTDLPTENAPEMFDSALDSQIVGIKIESVSWDEGEVSGEVFSLESATGTAIVGSGIVAHNCFPKDVQALVATGREFGVPQSLLEATEAINQRQKKTLLPRIDAHFEGDLKGKTFAMWGLAFKPNTDDIREAPALVLIEELLERGAQVAAYDPEAMEAVERVYGSKFGDRIRFGKRHYDVCEGADALIIVTEWPKFREPDFGFLHEMLNFPVIFDGRNVYDLETMHDKGFTYYSIGRPTIYSTLDAKEGEGA